MKLRLKIVLLLVSSGLSGLISQNSISIGAQYSVILRTNSNIELVDHHLYGFRQYEYEQDIVQTPGIKIMKEDSGRWLQEFAIIGVQFDEMRIGTQYEISERGYKVRRAYCHGEYGLGYNLRKSKRGKFHPIVGLSLEPIIERMRVLSYTEHEHNWKELSISLGITGYLSGEIRISRELKIGIKGSLRIVEMNYGKWEISSPSLKSEEREGNTIEGLISPKIYRGTIGIIYEIN